MKGICPLLLAAEMELGCHRTNAQGVRSMVTVFPSKTVMHVRFELVS